MIMHCSYVVYIFYVTCIWKHMLLMADLDGIIVLDKLSTKIIFFYLTKFVRRKKLWGGSLFIGEQVLQQNITDCDTSSFT